MLGPVWPYHTNSAIFLQKRAILREALTCLLNELASILAGRRQGAKAALLSGSQALMPSAQAPFQGAMLGNGEADAFDPIAAVHTGPIASEPPRKKPAYLAMGQEVTK